MFNIPYVLKVRGEVVKDESGKPVHFDNRQEAENYAFDELHLPMHEILTQTEVTSDIEGFLKAGHE